MAKSFGWNMYDIIVNLPDGNCVNDQFLNPPILGRRYSYYYFPMPYRQHEPNNTYTVEVVEISQDGKEIWLEFVK